MYYEETYYDPLASQTDTLTGSEKNMRMLFWISTSVSCILAYFLYTTGQKYFALAAVGAVLLPSMLIAPQISLYLYFAWQAFDSVLLGSKQAVLTPAKALSLFILVLYVLAFSKVRHKIRISKGVLGVFFMFGIWGIIVSGQALAPLASLTLCSSDCDSGIPCGYNNAFY